MNKIKLVKPSAHQGEYAVHLTCYLSLRRHYPDQVWPPPPSNGGVNSFTLLLPFRGGGPGFDLSLSFSLIAQSKAPLENYAANIGFLFKDGRDGEIVAPARKLLLKEGSAGAFNLHCCLL